MAVVTTEKLSSDLQASASALVESAGLVPQSRDQPLSANDLLFYLDDTSMPMADFLQAHGLFVDRDGVWKRFDLCEDEAVEGNGTYLLVVLSALELLYGSAA